MRLSLTSFVIVSLFTTTAHAQSSKETAHEIASQPAADVNLKKVDVPEKLKKIQKKPYSLKNLNSCKALSIEIAELNEVLGPDIDEKVDKKASQKRNATAQRVGSSLTGSIIPFRGIVREVSGAAKAQRKLNTAIAAGVSRRGFLKGIGQQRGCGQSARPVSVK